jgi:hypothetical protein
LQAGCYQVVASSKRLIKLKIKIKKRATSCRDSLKKGKSTKNKTTKRVTRNAHKEKTK